MERVKYIVLVVICLFYGSLGSPKKPIVDTALGPIVGLSAPDGDYSMYLGIPYASVDPYYPFGESIPNTGFETTFYANDDTIVCPQREEFNNTLVGILDCLRLNVYVPHKAGPNRRLPVLIYIHGGGFYIGFSGRYSLNPKYLVRHDVIVVTINYRLGAYGFMCLDTPEVPGNQGLKDQLTALRWIKDNIEAFGGDSNQITISGQSAGGSSVDYHLAYTDEDLFRNVIMQSGSSLAPFALGKSDPNAALKLSDRLGYTTDDTNDALAFLSSVDPQSVIAASEDFLKFLPCVEKYFDDVDGFITVHPALVRTPKDNTVSILIGFNSNELGTVSENSDPEMYKQNVFSQIEQYFNFSSKYGTEMEDTIRHFYIGDENMSESVKSQLVNFGADFNVYHPIYRTIEKYSEDDKRAIFFYEFSYDGGRNYIKVKNNVTTVPGAVHADELGYLFGIDILNKIPTAEDQLIIDRMTTMWTNFVKYGEPIPVTSDILPECWPAIEKDVLYCLNIDSVLSVQKRPFSDRMSFWDLFYKLNSPYLKLN